MRRDLTSTALAALVVLVYLANANDWGLPLLGSNRWAAGAIGLLGIAMCNLGGAGEGGWSATTIALSVVGVVALLVLALALVDGAQSLLLLLAIVTLLLWAVATLRHAAVGLVRRPPHTA